MSLSIPTSLYPVFESSLLVGKEAPSTPGVAPTAFTAIPTGIFQPNNKVTWLEDQNLRGSNVKTYNLGQGPIWAEHKIPTSPCYGDTIGYMLLSLMGDYYATGTAGTPTWTTNGALTAGATSITVTSGSTAAANSFIQVDSTAGVSEVVKVGSGSTATNIVLATSTPLRFNHLTAITVTTVTAPFTHVFSNLNPNSSTGSTSAQPPSYTWLHRNYIAGSGNNNADQYLYSHVSELKFTGKADGWFAWDGMATSYSRSYPATNISPSFTSVQAIPAWNATTSLASSSIYNISDISFTLQRELDVVPTADGSQNPYVIGAGPFSAMFTVDYDVVADETQLNYMLNNTQPTLAWSISNGLSGASLVSFSIAAQLMAHKDSPLTAMKTFWGWRTTGEFMANTTNAGNSGGYSPLQITLQNAIPTY